MDKAALFALLMQQAPRLLAALNKSGGLENNPGIENALDSGYDIPLMETKFAQNSKKFGLDNGLLATDITYGNDIARKGFPSDFATQNDIQAIAEGLRVGETPAEISAGTFLANPEQKIPKQLVDNYFPEENIHEPDYVPVELPPLNASEKKPTPDVVPGTDIPWNDEDMDALHSNEGWEDGSNYKLNPKLIAWYKKHHR